MDDLKTDPKQILIFYNPENNTHKKTIAHAEGSGKAVRSFAYDKAPTANNIWMAIFQGLTEDDKKYFFERDDERYNTLIADKDYSFEDWKKICLNNTDLIKYPIAISGKKVILVRRPSEVLRLQELDFTDNRKQQKS